MKTKLKGMTPYKKGIIDKVTELVCSEFSINRNDIFTKSRAYAYCIPRMVAIGILRNKFKFTYSSLSDYYGYTHGSSIAHASKSLDHRIKEDPEIASVVKSVLKQLNP